MFRIARVIFSIAFCLLAFHLYAIEVITKDGDSKTFSLEQLKKESQVAFKTERHKKGSDITDNWKGIDLHLWLKKNKLTDWQSLRFESSDNYMVRLHKAELDTMPGYIALQQNGSWLDSTEARVIFPKQRDMFWIRGIARIYLEDFKPLPKPRQIFVWEAAAKNLSLIDEPEPFKEMQGYTLQDIMSEVFCQGEGSVVLVSRDGIRMRLEFPRHLGGAILEQDKTGNLNLKSPAIPAGMWLKDIVYLQCGPYALLRQEHLYSLVRLSQTLGWNPALKSTDFIKATVTKQLVKLDVLADPPFPAFEPDDWIVLP